MSKNSRMSQIEQRNHAQAIAAQEKNKVTSLFDIMVDGKEYSSIIDKILKNEANLLDEVHHGITEIEKVRGRPCLMYVGNVVSKDATEAGIDSSDDLPFQEMVASIPASVKVVDIYLSTNGGSGEQISRFVNCLRARFEEVNFLIPSFCMSAGTLFALSGEHIFMTQNACLGPIDPQVPSVGGRYVPAQALLLLVEKLQKDGDQAMANGGSVPWTAVRLIDSLDKKELGAAITASQWSQTIAAQYLFQYKFKNWKIRESSQHNVTDDYKNIRAGEVASALVSHDKWKSHGHAISREVLWSEIKLKIDHPDAVLERVIKRHWAVLTYIFEKTSVQKMICSANYRYAKFKIQQIIGS